MKEVGGEADCRRICEEKSINGRLWVEGMRIRRKMNGVGKRSLTADGSAKKRKGGGG